MSDPDPTCFERVPRRRTANILLPSFKGRALLALPPGASRKPVETYCLGQPDPGGNRVKLSKVGLYCFLPALPGPQAYDDLWVALLRYKAFSDFKIPGKGVKYLAWITATKTKIKNKKKKNKKKKKKKKKPAIKVSLHYVIEVDRKDRVARSVCFPFRNASLVVPKGATLVVNEACNGFRVTGALELVPSNGAGATVAVERADVLIPEDDRQGTLEFDVVLGEAQLHALEVGLSYAWNVGDRTHSQLYPVFSVAEGTAGVRLRGHIDPYREGDPTRTVYTFADGAAPVVSYLRTIHGWPVALTPQGVGTDQAPRLVFKARPDEGLYLAPTGTFTVAQPAGEDGMLSLMGGLSGSEFLRLSPGDALTFVGDRPALAQGFVPPDDGHRAGSGAAPSVPTLTDGFETSWVRMEPASPVHGTDSSLAFGYCVQPEHATYYARASFDFPLAAGALISPLAPTDGARATVPLAPYAGVRLVGTDQGASAATVAALERQLLEPTRRSLVDLDQVDGPRFFDPIGGAPLAGGYARTPRGLLVSLNDGGAGEGPSGSWKSLILAASPEKPDQVLAIDAAGEALQPPSRRAADPAVVSPSLANALMDDGLFMVVSDPTYLGTFARNEIRLGDFTFELDVGPQATILLLKLTTQWSVRQLVAQTGLWTERDIFVGASELAVVQKRILGWLDEAAGSGESLFRRFNQIVDTPDWTGILALNCGLDAAAFPPDIQVLMGGIAGKLRARYFGVTLNQVDGTGAEWSIEKSSLEALVHYAHDFDLAKDALGFQVLKLDALFVNSALNRFGARVAVSLPTLFGADVRLASKIDEDFPPSAIAIDGVYQRNDGAHPSATTSRQGSLVFTTKAPRTFAVEAPGRGRRVLESVQVGDATLVPESSATLDGKTVVRSRIALSGHLDFNRDASPDGVGTDLFSYGQPGERSSLAYSDYAIEMRTTIEDNEGKLDPLTASAAAVQVSTAGVEPRKESLARALPLKVSAFRSTGLDRSTARAFNITGGYLVGGDGDESEPALTDTVPDFALSLSLSLGSLGALSSVADNLDVEVLLGWKAGADASTGDQVSMWLVPPEEMGGVLGFAIEGVLGSTFEQIRLVEVEWSKDGTDEHRQKVFVIQFMTVQVTALGLSLIPGTSATNFTLFADPDQGNASNLGWLLTVRAPKLGG